MDQSVSPHPFGSIAGFELTEAVARGLAADKIITPTAVQQAAIPPILEGRNVIIESATGTGKTLAYLLPVLQLLCHNKTSRATCYAPATELAVQTMRVAERYKDPSLATAALVATGNQRLMAERLQKSTRLIVGTPGRILEMVSNRKLKGVNLVVLDEPEPILASNQGSYLREVMSRPEPKLQFILAAATFGSHTERFISDYLGTDPVRTKVADDPLRNQIQHRVVRVHRDGDRDVELVRFIRQKKCKRAIVFVNSPHLVRHLYRTLNEQGIIAVTVSKERTKLQISQALRDFRTAKANVLILTDHAATGLDLARVPWVLHYELPNSAQAYVHRAGRTGRAGETGTSVVFVGEGERAALGRLEEALRVEFRQAQIFHWQ